MCSRQAEESASMIELCLLPDELLARVALLFLSN